MFDLNEEIRKGSRAKQLIKDELFETIFETLHEIYVEEWEAADTCEKRERIHAHVIAMRSVREHLDAIASSGVLAEEQLRSLRL